MYQFIPHTNCELLFGFKIRLITSIHDHTKFLSKTFSITFKE